MYSRCDSDATARRGRLQWKCEYVYRNGKKCGANSLIPGGCHNHRGRAAAIPVLPCDKCGSGTISRHVRDVNVGLVPLCPRCSTYARKSAEHRKRREEESRAILEKRKAEETAQEQADFDKYVSELLDAL